MGNLREAYQSSIANRANEIMRVFTAITTIFMPLTVITGIYGMNFDNIPEIHTEYGYYGVIAVMVTLGCGMLIIFRKRSGYEAERTNTKDEGTVYPATGTRRAFVFLVCHQYVMRLRRSGAPVTRTADWD